MILDFPPGLLLVLRRGPLSCFAFACGLLRAQCGKLQVWNIRFLSGGGPGLFEVNYSQVWSSSDYTLSTWYQDFSVCSLIFAILVHSNCSFFSNLSQQHPRPTTKIHSVDGVCVTSSRFYALICSVVFVPCVEAWLGMKMQLPVSLQREGCGRNWCEHGMSKGIFYQGTVHFVSVCHEFLLFLLSQTLGAIRNVWMIHFV